MMHIQGIGLATPGHAIDQTDLLTIAMRYNADSDADRIKLKRIYRGAKVQKRHSVLGGDGNDSRQSLDNLLRFYQPSPAATGPSTQQRMAIYEEHAIKLATRSCQQALANNGVQAKAITQLITASCTGFSAPGHDAALIDALRLRPTVARTHIGFMGCHAALNALRVANAFTSNNPDELVLICCTELCTLHFQYGNDPQDAIANALFADGSAALVTQGDSNRKQTPAFKSFHAEKVEHTTDMMSWHIGDHGFKMRLLPQVPNIIGQTLKPSIASWLAEHRLTVDAINGWLIHPGGPKIIDAVQEALSLDPQATEPSREVLRRFGNMSSPTLLFVLDAAMQRGIPKPWVMLGFGPGLAIEAALLV